MSDAVGPLTLCERVAGCFLGGAVGDALGASVEFHSRDEILSAFGEGGIRDFAPAYGRPGAITDDTQMTLFTAEGLIRAANQAAEGVPCDTAVSLHSAYLRWLTTQDERPASRRGSNRSDGWLLEVPGLHAQRAPGFSCLSALRSGCMGTRAAPINNSKGCGGLMRAAPAGLVSDGDPDLAFRLGCEAAAITHGHPTGYLSAGAFAVIVDRLAAGVALAAAIDAGRERLRLEPDAEETLAAIDAALEKAETAPGSVEDSGLGQGWVAEEALAIALYCVLLDEDFEKAVVRAVNHSGDSDSTGAIAGNLLGVALGAEAIPMRWLDKLELRAEIGRLADDLVISISRGPAQLNGSDWLKRYPPG